MFFSKKIIPKKKYELISGWNKNVKHYYKKARNFYLTWKSHNKPCYGFLCDKMKECCKNFKSALCRCRQNKKKHQANQLASPLLTDRKSFWRKVKRICHDNLQALLLYIGDAVGSEKIAEMWQDQYCHLLTVHKSSAKNIVFVEQQIKSKSNYLNCELLCCDVNCCGPLLYKLLLGSSTGKNQISA